MIDARFNPGTIAGHFSESRKATHHAAKFTLHPTIRISGLGLNPLYYRIARLG